MIGWSWIVLLIDGKSACVWLLLQRHTDNIYTLGRPISGSICLLGVLCFHPTMSCHAMQYWYVIWQFAIPNLGVKIASIDIQACFIILNKVTPSHLRSGPLVAMRRTAGSIN
jgi:hypothetical protein